MGNGGERSEANLLLEEMHEGFDALERLIVRGGAVLFGTMVIGFVGLIVTMIFTQH